MGSKRRPPCPGSLFERALGEAWHRLPAPVRDLHAVVDTRIFHGRADVERGRTVVARLIAATAGFPPAGRDQPVEVVMERTGDGEVWTRRFGSRTFRSWLDRREDDPAGLIRERFGPFAFEIGLLAGSTGLEFPVRRATAFGLPLPGFLVPVSETHEFVGADSAVWFDVTVRLGNGSLVVRYSGSLSPAEADRTGG